MCTTSHQEKQPSPLAYCLYHYHECECRSEKDRKDGPPTPTPITANKEASATKLGAPPAASPNIPAMAKVMLKDHLGITWNINDSRSVRKYLLPQISHPSPQNTAPTRRPTFEASDRKGPLKWNSLTTGARMSPLKS